MHWRRSEGERGGGRRAATVLLPIGVAVLLQVVLAGLGAGTAAAYGISGSTYTPIQPCRVLDTRSTAGGPTPFGPGVTRDIQVAGSGANFAAQGGKVGGCSVPDGAAAVEVTITAVEPTASGFVRAWPAGQAEPTATVLNYSGGRNISNSVSIPLASAGTLDLRLRNAGASTQLIVDVLGYHDTTLFGERFVPITPCRIADSRVTNGQAGSPYGPGTSRDLQVAGTGAAFATQGGVATGCAIPLEATAVEVSLTATATTAAGFVRAWPVGQSEPNATVLNYVAGQGVTNTASVPVAAGVGADLTVRNLGGTAHLLADVQGYWVPSEGSYYVPVTPCRLVDTRSGTPVGLSGARPLRIGGDGPGFTQQGGAAGGCTIPEDATAVEVSLTAVDVSGVGFTRLWPGDRTEPGAAALNFGPGQNTTNSGTVALSRSGLVDLVVRNYSPQSHYIVDVLGYFSPAPDWIPQEVTAGTSFACATFTDPGPVTSSDLRCWGSNQFGQLGDDTTTTRRFPGPVTGVSAVVDVDAGGSHACAVVDLAPDDQLRCWGRNDRGQVGKGDFLSPVDVPTTVTLPFVPLDVEAGELHTCVLSALLPQDGSQLACWGENGSGQLGLGDTLDRFTPQIVDLAGAVAFDVATGANHTCAVVTGGAVRCWGSNQFGQLGAPLGTTSSSTPLTVPGVVAERVVVGDAHTCVTLQSDQSVRCWGLGTSGQLGNGSNTSSTTPVSANFRSGTQLIDLAAGGSTTCAREASTATWCWGAGTGGQIGDGASLNRNQPTRPAGLQRYDSIAVGASSTCGVTVQRLECWGVNGSGAVGDTTTTDRPRPVTVQLGPVQVSVGDRHACALRTGGTVWCWGANSSGQLANTEQFGADRTTPVQVSSVLTPGAVAVESGVDHTCALRADATLWCWGENGSGQVGVPGSSDVTAPTQVAGLTATPVLQVAAGGAHTCAVLVDRTVRCWGSDAQGQLGDGTAGGSTSTPTTPVGVGEVLSVTVGWRHTCAVRADGTVWCWGENTAGQLGRGTTVSPGATPLPVVQLAGVGSVTAGEFHTCATLAAGAARCWGTNSSFQLGNGTTVDSSVPVTVLRATLGGDVPATGLQSLDAGGFHGCAVSREGLVDLGLCWGANLSGQLGGGVPLLPGYPQLVTVVDRVRQLSGGGDSTCAVAEDGGAWCFGDNSSGQLGRGTTNAFGVANPAPVQVTGLGPI